jgi:hypothetical protein
MYHNSNIGNHASQTRINNNKEHNHSKSRSKHRDEAMNTSISHLMNVSMKERERHNKLIQSYAAQGLGAQVLIGNTSGGGGGGIPISANVSMQNITTKKLTY